MTGPYIKTYQDLQKLPLEFKSYRDDEFLLLEVITEDNKCIHIYGSKSGLHILQNSTQWAGDGTHRKCPKPFGQLYVIGAILEEHFMPSLYCLLPDHCFETYLIVFRFIKTKCSSVPSIFVIDFEQAVVLALKQVFPNLKITGCLFHFQQNLFRNILKKNPSYRKNQYSLKTFKLLKALVFTPPGFILDIFNDAIKPYAQKHKIQSEMSTFFTYFENTYVGLKHRNGKIKPPLFEVDMWCMFHVLNENTSTTNNSLEAFNGNFNKSQPGTQTIYTAIQGFQREVEYTEIKLKELTEGTYKETHVKRKQLRDEKYRKIREQMLKYDNTNVLEYLTDMINIM